MAGFYEVTMNGSVGGQDHLNSLYYRTVLDIGGGALGFGGAQELAEEVMQEVVPAWLNAHPASYTLQSIDILPRNGLFEALYQLPYRLPVNDTGNLLGGDPGFDSPAISVNFRFNLEPTLFGLQTFTAPKRGYLSVGPVPSNIIDDDGKLTDNFFTNPNSEYNALCAALSQNLESVDPPCVWFPIRVAKHWGSASGGLLGFGYADVMSCSYDRYTSYRRSRRVTG